MALDQIKVKLKLKLRPEVTVVNLSSRAQTYKPGQPNQFLP